MHGRVHFCMVAAFRVYVGMRRNMDKKYRNKFPNTFSNLRQAEHDNVTETCLCGAAMACGHVTHKILPCTAKHQLT
jgi:hypothetical protein